MLPALVAGYMASAHAPLTVREREIANLATTGRPDREIAAMLGLSVRTVDNTLQRAFTKLGVSSRADLADVHLRGDD